MKIEFRNVTRAGNNVNCAVYFDDIIVAPHLNCTPAEFDRILFLLGRLNEEDEIVVSEA